MEQFLLGGVTLPQNTFKPYEKLHCKREPYRFSGYKDPMVQTLTHIDRQRSCYFYVRKWTKEF